MRVAGRSGATLVLATILTGPVVAQPTPTPMAEPFGGYLANPAAAGLYVEDGRYNALNLQGGLLYKPQPAAPGTGIVFYDPEPATSDTNLIWKPQLPAATSPGIIYYTPQPTEAGVFATDTPAYEIKIPQASAEPPIWAQRWTDLSETLNTPDWEPAPAISVSDWVIAPTPDKPRFDASIIESYLDPDKQFSFDSFADDAANVVSANEGLFEGLGTRAEFTSLATDLKPLVDANPVWGAVFAVEMLENSKDLLAERSAPEWQGLIDNLQIAHELRNPAATAMLGESYLLGRGVEMNEPRALDYLEQAVAAGDLRAMTRLGSYAYDLPSIMSQDMALQLSRQALAGGDANAAGILGYDAYQRGEIDESVDFLATTVASGSPEYAEQARIHMAMNCSIEGAVCSPLTVAVATSREPGSITEGLPWLDHQSGAYATNFAFAQTMVPFDGAALQGEPPPPNFFQSLQELFRADQFGRSTFVLPDAGLAQPDAFFGGLQTALDQAQGDEKRILLYVHGFNNSVEDALLAMARLKQRGRLPGVPVIYSWAAGKGLARPNFENATFYSGYSRDVQMASNSCFAFSSFLADLSTRFGAGNIILVAHSHGAKLVHSALTGCEFRSEAVTYVGGRFDSVIYAAPDIDLDQFDQSFATLANMAERVAIYVSSQDQAIWASSNVIRGGMPRVGGAVRKDFGNAIEVIDASSITDPSKDAGHSYAFINYQALSDMRRFLNGEVAADRCLEPINGTGPGWWLPECD